VDLQLYARVLWRFKVIVLLGLVLALTLALLSTVRVGRNGATYRSPELWSSSIRLLVTQRGFPEGRLYAQVPIPPGEINPPAIDSSAPVVDPARFNSLAILYSELATSDAVRQLMRKQGPIPGQIVATPLRDERSGTLLPLLDLSAVSTSPGAAIVLARRGAAALNRFVADQQRVNNVPPDDRVVLTTIVQPKGAQLFQPRSKTMPIVVFLVVMFAVVGLVFLLESVRPRSRQAEADDERDLAKTPAQRASA
jgi:hypothetical protein